MVHTACMTRRQQQRFGITAVSALLMASRVCDAAPLRGLAPGPGPAAVDASSSAAAALVAKCRLAATPTFLPVCSASNVTLLNAAWAACSDGHPTTPGACLQSPAELEAVTRCTQQKCGAEPFAMVCGIDGQSYANACVAACSGLGWVRGECCACPARAVVLIALFDSSPISSHPRAPQLARIQLRQHQQLVRSTSPAADKTQGWAQ